MKKIYVVLVFCLLFFKNHYGQYNILEAQNWALDKYNKMSLDEKIGQLFMVAAYSGGANYNENAITSLITNYKIGGLIFMQGSVNEQLRQCNKFQDLSKVPLLIAMDAEWGLGMRLNEVQNFQKNIMLGATRDSFLVYRVAEAIANQCSRLGVQVDFAPVIDVNNNPNNPVINFRSFGEDKQWVSTLGIAYALGLQNNKVLACAKHFPGHGDTDVDSHKDLPTISKSLSSLQNLELYPFQKLIDNNVMSMMVAHLNIPAIDPKFPTTLSYNCITDLLRDQMQYKGLVFTDALNMQGVAKYYSPGEVDLKAFLAGNDVLLFSQNVPKAMEAIKKAYNDGTISNERLKASVMRILTAKYYTNAHKNNHISGTNIMHDLNSSQAALNREVAQKGITVVKDNNQILQKANSKILYVSLGKPSVSLALIGQNKNMSYMSITPSTSAAALNKYISTWKKYDKVILGVHGVNKYPNGNYGLSAALRFTANFLASKLDNSMILINGNPYALQYFCDAPSIMVNYEETSINFEESINIIQNKYAPNGKLPVSPCSAFKVGMGLNSSSSNESTNIGYNNKTIKTNTTPNSTSEEKKNFDFSALDNSINRFISGRVFPGCQILVAKDGKVLYNKAFGTMSYEGSLKVNTTDVYDIASVTKIAATTLAVMKLYEEKKINLDATLGTYLPWVRGTNKDNLKIRDILLHQAGLVSWIPFYKNTFDTSGNYKNYVFSNHKSIAFDIPVCKNLYMNKMYIDTMWNEILDSKVSGKSYVYSDLDFMFLQKVVETLTKEKLDVYVEKTFYKKLQLTNIGYNPVLKNWKRIDQIPPSEYDNYFRKEIVRGYVHDPGAAMLGGVAGHAGIFSNATCLFVLMQMLINGGEYEGVKLLNSETINLFTSYQSNISRRGLGFDKPGKAGQSSPTGKKCSSSTFGHQGFTGTCVWADPINNVVFVFLSNRTYPTQDNKLINKYDVREDLQDAAYKALGL